MLPESPTTPLQKKALLVITGPTGIGKTSISVAVAKALNTEIISADSRQFFSDMSIGTARTSEAEMQGVPHHFTGFLPVENYYSAGKFEADALAKLHELHQMHSVVVMTGGSGLYVDAVCNGIDEIPQTDAETRGAVQQKLETQGLDALLKELQAADPEYYETVDQKNPRRILRALEVIRISGRPYSSFRKKAAAERPFNVIKVGLRMEREALYARINARVDAMMAAGQLEEARKLLPKRALPALETVGYSELFKHLDGELTLAEAVDRIKQNTRRYAKRQLTWLAKDEAIVWFDAGPNAANEILQWLNKIRTSH